MNEFEYDLKYALTGFEGDGKDPFADLTKVRVRPIRVTDIVATENVQGGDFTKTIVMLSKMSGLPRIAIERLDSRDYAVLHARVQKDLLAFSRALAEALQASDE